MGILVSTTSSLVYGDLVAFEVVAIEVYEVSNVFFTIISFLIRDS